MSQAAADVPFARASRREIVAWALYDWANSAYTTLSLVAMMYYLTEFVLPKDSPAATALTATFARLGKEVDPERWGMIVWALGLSAAMFTAALLSPIIGAMADARATKRWWLSGTALSGAMCVSAMAFVPADYTWTNIALFVVGSLLFDLSFGVYNGFLPELADESNINRISAWGYAAGYLGGGIALAIEMLVIKNQESLGITIETALRFGLLLMGVWWGLFTLPALFWLRDRTPPTAPRARLASTAVAAFRQVKQTLAHVRRYRTLVIFLIGFLFYNDGIQTVISEASTFAKSDLDFQPDELLLLVLCFQFISLAGALIDSLLTDRIGQKKALMIYLGVWVACLGSAYFVTEKSHFWLLSIPLGLVMGGAQTVSRSIMATLTPPRHNAEFFGFFNFSGKATSWMGNLTFAAVILATNGSARWAIMSLFVFFVIGWGFASAVDLARGRREALGQEPP